MSPWAKWGASLASLSALPNCIYILICLFDSNQMLLWGLLYHFYLSYLMRLPCNTDADNISAWERHFSLLMTTREMHPISPTGLIGTPSRVVTQVTMRPLNALWNFYTIFFLTYTKTKIHRKTKPHTKTKENTKTKEYTKNKNKGAYKKQKQRSIQKTKTKEHTKNKGVLRLLILSRLLKMAATYSPTNAVPSARLSLTTLFGMGRGGTSAL